MSDILRSRLREMSEHRLMLGSYHSLVLEAIAELDRLEAEVKKPRLPEGYRVARQNDGADYITLHAPDGGLVSDPDEGRAAGQFLSAFLPTPDVVPSTEPVQADGAGGVSDREILITELREFSQMLPEGGDVDPLIEVFSGLADRCVAVLTTSIEASSQRKPRDLSIPKEWSERKAEEIGSDECAAGLLAADPFNMQAPASPSDQGQGSQKENGG